MKSRLHEINSVGLVGGFLFFSTTYSVQFGVDLECQWSGTEGLLFTKNGTCVSHCREQGPAGGTWMGGPAVYNWCPCRSVCSWAVFLLSLWLVVP